jgi:hypothetical protein
MFNKNSDFPAKNLGGRPKGTRNPIKSKSERLFERLMGSRGGQLTRIVDQVLKLAEEGDATMIKSVMDRCFPARGRVIKIDLSGDPATAIDRVTAMLARGEATASECKNLIDVLKARVDIKEAAELEIRLTKLEEKGAPQ